MKKPTTQTLATTEAALEKVIVPKPTKAEVIAALVEVARKEHRELSIALDREKADSLKALRGAIGKWLSQHPATVETLVSGAQIGLFHSTPEVEFRLGESSPASIRTLHEKARALRDKHIARFDEHQVKREIARKLSGEAPKSERVATLTASPQIAAMWEQMKSA